MNVIKCFSSYGRVGLDTMDSPPFSLNTGGYRTQSVTNAHHFTGSAATGFYPTYVSICITTVPSAKSYLKII
jgi:hypothetical protein